MDPEKLKAAKLKAIALVTALKKAENGKKLTSADSALLEWCTDDGRAKLTASLDGWAVALGRERRTLERILVRNGLTVTPGCKFTAKEIYIGIVGDEQAEKVRNLKLDADEKERKSKERDGILVPWEWCEKAMIELAGMQNSALDACPAEALEWLEKVYKPTMRQKLSKPKGEK